MILLLAGAAWAFTPAGYGVPELGGAFAGPSEDGAAGVLTNPAAAHPDRGSWMIDAGWLYSDLTYTLDLDPTFGLRSEGASVAPSLSGAEPFGPVGIGLAVFPVYARGGGPGAPEDGAQRFHTITGGIQVIEANLQAAVQLHPAWTIGVGARYGNVRLASTRAIDTGALVEELAGPGTGVPIGDPFLEGRQVLEGATGAGFGANVGVRFTPARGPWVSLAARSPMRVKVTGPLTLTPSTSLDMQLTATAVTTITLPAAAFLTVDVPIGRARIVPEVWWVGWSSYYAYETELTDLAVSSDDPYMESILASYGLTEAEFLQGAGGARSVTGTHDVVSAGVSAWLPFAPTVTGRVGAWYHSGAVPDETVHPGNLDFAMLEARAAVAWAPAEWLSIGLGGDWYHAAPRVITTSAHSLVAPEEPGALVPSGNGTYRITFARVGLSVILSHEPLGGRRVR